MLNHKLTIFIVILFLSACTTAEPTQTGSDIRVDVPQKNRFGKAKEMIFSGDVESIVQSHDRKVILQDKNGSQFIAIEPELDSVIQIVKQCGEKCLNVDIMTK